MTKSILPEYTSQLEKFQTLLLKWNSKINLIGKNTEGEIWQRHILDSAQIDKYIPPIAKTLADFGSGAGFPGIIIAILRPEISVHLIESDARKCAFLQEAKAQLQLSNVKIHNERIENIGRQFCSALRHPRVGGDLHTNITECRDRDSRLRGNDGFLKTDIITARAFSDLKTFLKLAINFQKTECLNILLKGSNLLIEIENAKKFYDFEVKLEQSETDESGKIAIITSIKKI